jgi:hypothetical protein
MSCYETIVSERRKNRHIAVDIDPDWVVMNAQAITYEELLEMCRFCGILDEGDHEAKDTDA